MKLLFQPDEEGVAPVEYCGGDAVLEAGVLENPHVDAVAALHVQALEFDAGAIYTRKGTIFSSIDDIDVAARTAPPRTRASIPSTSPAISTRVSKT